MAGERVIMKNIILAICLALSFSFTTVYSARQDNGGGNNSGEWHRIPYLEYDNDNGDYGKWDDYMPAIHTYPKDPSNDPGGPGCRSIYDQYSYDFYSPDKLQEKQDIQDPISPEESNRLDIGATVKDEAPSPQPHPQSISTAAAAYTTAEGIYYTDDISSGVYEFIPHKEPQPLIDIDMNDTGWLCEPPLPPTEEPILEDGGEAPDPCTGEPPIIGDPIVGEPPLPAEPTIGEPPLPIPEPTVGEPPLPPTVGEPPLAPDPELDVPVPDPVETE